MIENCLKFELDSNFMSPSRFVPLVRDEKLMAANYEYIDFQICYA
jgi:hypothetical protein